MQPLCPWDGFDRATMEFCERPLCAWVTQPSNTWSNVGYLLVGALVLRLAMREDKFHLSPIGWSAIAVGLGSTFFHASTTFVGEVFDIGAMFLFAVYWLTVDLHRLLGWSSRVQRSFYASVMVLSIVALLVQRTAGVAIFTAQITATFIIEIALRRRAKSARRKGLHPPHVDYKPLVKLSGMFLLAYTAWRLDYHRVLCVRDFHLLSGHAMWHLLNASCFYFLYRFFHQFPGRLRENAKVQE